MSWFCESGCVEQRPGDMIFDSTDLEMWRQSQGVPCKYVSGVHVVACSACTNLFEVWIKAQPFWDELIANNNKIERLRGELQSGKRSADEIETEMNQHETVTVKAWEAKAFPVINAWWTERRATVTEETKVRHAEQKAKKDAARAERDKARADKKS